MSENFQKIPPNNLDAEKAVLGAMLMEREAITTASELLIGEDFYRIAHKEIFEAIIDIFNKNEPVDLITLNSRLMQKNTLEAVGGVGFLIELQEAVPSIKNVANYAKLIKEKSLLRRLIKTAQMTAEDCYLGNDDVAHIIDIAEKNIFDISLNRSTRGYTHIKEVLNTNLDKLEELAMTRGMLTGVATGFTDLDNKLSGLQKSDLVLIAARPSMGKSAFMMNIVQHAATRNHVPTAVFSLEMSKEQLGQRLLCSEASIDSNKLRTGDLSEDDWVNIARALTPLSQSPIYIDDTPSISLSELRAKCRRLKIEHGLGLVVLDYLQLMSGGGDFASRQQEISEISRSLKALARELDVPVVALSQLSRGPEQRPDHRPLLSDLRESGAIEQDADVVMFLYRDEYYFPETEEKNIGEVIIAKQRNGPTGTVKLVWLGEYTKFANKQ